MAEGSGGEVVRAGLSEAEMRERVVHLVFGGDPRRLEEFCDAVRQCIPDNTAAVLRGSAVTGERHNAPRPSGARSSRSCPRATRPASSVCT